MQTHRSILFVLAAALLLPALAGCISLSGDVDAADVEAPEMPQRPRVVVAVIDTGINLYHSEFERAAAEAATLEERGSLAHVVPGLEATSVALSLLEDEWEEAIDADWDGLMAMEDRVLYTFPGTKVVGAISFQRAANDWPLILDRPGSYTHGTMTSSRAVGNMVSLVGGDPDVHLVLIQGFSVEAIAWAQAQPWIDIVSISAGISPFGVVPLVPNALDTGQTEAYQALAHTRPFFASSGNGVGNAGLLGFPSWTRGSSGAPDVISVGANDNGRMSQWHNFDSYIAADGCQNPAAHPGHTDAITNSGGGTSSATPFSAGGGAALLLEARRILGDTEIGPRIDESLPLPEGWHSLAPKDHQVVLARGEAGLVESGPLADGVFTLLEFKQALYMTALAEPVEVESDGAACITNFPLDPALVPAEARFPLQGYGEVNHLSIEHALRVVRGEADVPVRPIDDDHYVRAHATKAMMMETM